MKRWMRTLVACSCLFLFGGTSASAEIALDGYLIARSPCAAFQSLRQGTNPGNVRVEVDRAYVLHAKNRAAATHYLIEVPTANPSRRWVEVGCGEHVVPADGSVVSGGGGSPGGGGASGEDYLLAVSWQPAFCETHSSKPECATQSGDRFDATHLALHGLWPQPRNNIYCGVANDQVKADGKGRWDQLDPVELGPDTRTELDRVMPGTQSHLERHEWTKHGTCFGEGGPEEYFRKAVALMDALNASGVQGLFEAEIGATVSSEDVRAAFDAAFGAGAGSRVELDCTSDGDRRLITELRLYLRGEIDDEPDLGALLFASPTVSPGCSTGIVDPVGLQ